jgi:hypothetical protein
LKIDPVALKAIQLRHEQCPSRLHFGGAVAPCHPLVWKAEIAGVASACPLEQFRIRRGSESHRLMPVAVEIVTVDAEVAWSKY